MRAKPLVLVVLGTRPEAIKLAPVVAALRKIRGLECRVLSTGQHRALLDRTLADLRLKVWKDLSLMRRDQAPGELAKRAFAALLPVIERERPALVVVQGDTTTALAGALAAAHEDVPVGHVEAGVRSGDLSNPFPEEANRIVIDDLSALLFAPTREAARRRRGAAGRVFVTGNTVVDALRSVAPRARARRGTKVVLVTMHRRESFEGGLAQACAAMRELLDRRPDVRIVFPVHLNPRVQKIVRAALRHPRALLLPPLGYRAFVAELSRCRFVLTDSGGVQEEAASLGKPALVLRRVTDRPEAVRAGVAVVTGLDPKMIVARAERLLDDEKEYRRMTRRSSVFGDGRAGTRVAGQIRRFLRVKAP